MWRSEADNLFESNRGIIRTAHVSFEKIANKCEQLSEIEWFLRESKHISRKRKLPNDSGKFEENKYSPTDNVTRP